MWMPFAIVEYCRQKNNPDYLTYRPIYTHPDE